jgi:hypothetical protein
MRSCCKKTSCTLKNQSSVELKLQSRKFPIAMATSNKAIILKKYAGRTKEKVRNVYQV